MRISTHRIRAFFPHVPCIIADLSLPIAGKLGMFHCVAKIAFGIAAQPMAFDFLSFLQRCSTDPGGSAGRGEHPLITGLGVLAEVGGHDITSEDRMAGAADFMSV